MSDNPLSPPTPDAPQGDSERDGEDLPKNAQYLRQLYEITSDPTWSFDEKLAALFDLGCEWFDMDVGGTCILDPDTNYLEIETVSDDHPVLQPGTQAALDDTFCKLVADGSGPVSVVNPVEQEFDNAPCADAFTVGYETFGVRSYLGTRIELDGDHDRSFWFITDEPRDTPITEEERTYHHLMGEWLRKELERQHRDDTLAALNQLERELMDATTIDAVCDRVIDAADTQLGLPVTAIALHNPQTDQLQPTAATESATDLLTATDILTEAGAATQVFQTGTPIRLEDPIIDAADAPPITEVAVYPLGTHGVFVTASTTRDGFGAADDNFIETVAANLTVAFDRTERERQLKRQNERLESFASMLAHELRNPLQIAQIYLQQLDGDPEAVQQVEAAHDRIEEMIDVLLVTARSTDSNIEWEDVPLAEVATEAWDNVEADGATLTVETDIVVQADRTHLHHLFTNLFRNAVDHAGDDVTLRVGQLAADSSVGFYVADDGPGIPDAERDQVFDAGYTTTDNGIGLGLTFVKQLADTYDWAVTITESWAGGARFEFRTAADASQLPE